MNTVQINTSDLEWIARRGIGEPVAHGTDIQGAVYFTTTVEVGGVERVKFAGAPMIRFDLGPDSPRDHNRWAMYPITYLVVPGDCACGEPAIFADAAGSPMCPDCAAAHKAGGGAVYRQDGSMVPAGGGL